MPRSWKPEVVADSTGNWYGNGIRFYFREEAEGWVFDRMMRWTAVRDTRTVESDDAPTHCWVSNQLVSIEPPMGA